jgi:LPS export ABC transporter protein LptC
MTLFRPRNLLLLLALLVLSALAAIVVLRYRPAADVAELVKSLPSGVDVALQEIRYSHSEGGLERWRLIAGRIERRSAENLTAVRDLEFTFFDEKGNEQGVLKARNGQVNADYSVLEVHDHVEIVSRDGYTLQTERLTYRQQDRSISTDAPVKLTSDRLLLEGDGMHLDLNTQTLRILARVRATIQPDPKKRKDS